MQKAKIFVALLLCLCVNLRAQDAARPDAHAPIGVMGDHTHKKGEFMVSYRYMRMAMQDNLTGTDEISEDEIATTVPNIFVTIEGQPPTLRVVPTTMNMNMHMIGMMYAPSDRLTLMAMGMFLSSEMDHTTYQSGMGTTVLGEFTTESSGIGDTRLTALIKVTENLHVNMGLSLPTGTIENDDEVLTPMNVRITTRLPYPMQIGSGTWDFLPGITYVSCSAQWGWGTQVNGTIRLGENNNDFRYGHQLNAAVWGSYLLRSWLSSSLRVSSINFGDVEGRDPEIVAPVQTANPDFQGGNRVDLSVGLNVIGQSGLIRNQRLAIEFALPVYQDLNGPQLAVSNILTIGWQYTF
ncbi:MAG: transporter [Bacteroidota bacterium]